MYIKCLKQNRVLNTYQNNGCCPCHHHHHHSGIQYSQLCGFGANYMAWDIMLDETLDIILDSGKSPGLEVFLRLDLWCLILALTTGTHRVGEGLDYLSPT